MSTTPAQRRQDMMTQFNQYRATVVDTLTEIEGMLKRGEYALAARTMTALSESHARSSVAMRGALVRNGFLARGSNDD